MQTSDEVIKVDMTRYDAALFILFQKYYDKFGFLMQAEVLDIKGGNAILHFGQHGELLKIKKELFCYPQLVD